MSIRFPACEVRTSPVKPTAQRQRHAPPGICFALAAATVFAFAASQAQGSVSWSATSGDWSVSTDWSGGVPTSSATVYVINGGTAAITLPGATCAALYLGDPNSANSGTIQMTGGSLAAYDQYVGNNGMGTSLAIR
jgi:hypothetical protein